MIQIQMKKIAFTLSILTSILFGSCEVVEFDLLDDPNRLPVSQASPDFLLNDIQLQFRSAMTDFSRGTDRLMRYEAMVRDNYTDIASPTDLNTEWNRVYAIREAVQEIEDLVAEDQDFRFHRGIAKVLNAYGMATLVDYVGDIPFFNANQGLEMFNPAPDDDEAIYAALLEDIDLAIEDFNNVVFTPVDDLYFGKDVNKWIKLANTLKFKMLVNMGSVSDINALLAEGNLIETIEEDFQFQRTSQPTPVDGRHAFFTGSYEETGPGSSEYIANYFIWLLKDSKTENDPRLRYYLYRQTATEPRGNLLPCTDDPIFDFCYTGNFYWGRDHGDINENPNDRFLRTIYGLYPGGGSFDADNAIVGQDAIKVKEGTAGQDETFNLDGAGINPILLSSYVEFLKAEATLKHGADGNAAISLEAGMRKSMEKVLTFSQVDTLFVATSTDVDDYVAEVMDEYEVAASTDEKLDIVIREFYIATFGNSVEAYNAYRRTGFPSNIQVPIIDENIPFPRTFLLPQSAVDANSSLNQRSVTNKVFWDTNPDGFIK